MPKSLNTTECRFWESVRKTDTCWMWQKSLNGKGYGNFCIKRPKQMEAHKFAWLTQIGEIPSGLVLDHICRNRACVRPSHLRILTKGQNVLVGNGICANKARQTKCKNGHSLSGQNLILTKRGHRQCRECTNDNNRKSYADRN